MKRVGTLLGIILSVAIHAAPIQSGKAFFQTENIDASTGQTDATYYPLLAAPDKVSVTSTEQNPNALVPPYRVHSWMGGALLWATGQLEANPLDGYFVARDVPGSNVWPAELFQQAPLSANPIIFQYSEPPNQANSDQKSRGINLCVPFPFYISDASYDGSCSALNPKWATAPLVLQNDALPNLLIFPTDSAPTDGTQVGSIWAPNSILVDRIGDYDTDLIFQNPDSPYGVPDGSNPNGRGEYIKLTIVQGSPFIFCEVRGVEFVGLSNRMAGPIEAATAAADVPVVSKVDYSLFGGNQNNPAMFTEASSFNPSGEQDNFTTWAVYFKDDIGITFVPGSATTQPQNSHLKFPNTTDRFFFVIAAIPTIYAYPTENKSYATVTGMAGFDVKTYAEELGKYAFNFVTNTKVSYSVTNLTFLETTFSSTLTNPYGDSSMVAADSTVFCLMPHHYQDQTFATGLTPTVLDLDGSSDFTPMNGDDLFYWTVRGNLKAILGKGFKTNYIYSNFLPSMPPPFWTDSAVTATDTTTIGQLLFDNIDNEYINNLSNKAFAPWNTGYFSEDKGVYDVGKTLAKVAKELGLLQNFLQGIEDNAQESDPFHTFFFSTLIEQQYNNRPDLPNRPGAFNPPQSKDRTQSFRDALQSSIIGDLTTNPPLAGVQGAISPYFHETPIVTMGGYNLSHYAYYDPIGHIVMLYPSAGDPGDRVDPSPWPGRIQKPPLHAGPGVVWESFGVANANNDHHYQYGYWISASALGTLYDGAWKQTPDTGNDWGAQSNFGEAIDQLVQDIAYDPDIDASFFKNSQMSFAKLNYFDQWAGHGWADGIQATIAGGNAGHNENSIGEALQGYASIILWGTATGRKDIVDLGIYLYTTNAYAMDSYFFDKNLNLKKGQTPTDAFVPVTTKTGDTAYPEGSAFIDFTIHSESGGMPTSSGTPKIAQAQILYSTDFGQIPENIKLINAFPCSVWSLVFGRNKDYLNAWNASMDTTEFVATISDNLTTSTNCWKWAFVSNMNMLRMLGDNAIAFGQKDVSGTAPKPYPFMLDLFTKWGNPVPPWGLVGGSFADPSQSINEVLHFMHIIDHFGPPDWTIYGHALPDSNTLIFTASFTKGGTTTVFAFNPNLTPIQAQFFKVDGSTPSGILPTPLNVPPKRWASKEIP